jgi:RNA polymerase sigma-70 factor (ECF subfamily)
MEATAGGQVLTEPSMPAASTQTPHSEEARFLDFFLKSHSFVQRYVRTLVAVPSEVDDVVTAIFATAWNTFGSVPESSRRAWLLSLARHSVLEKVRAEQHAKRLRAALLELENEGQADEDTLKDADAVESEPLLAALAQLPDLDRVVVYLAASHELSVNEIADLLGISPATARIRLRRALRQMSADLSGEPSQNP